MGNAVLCIVTAYLFVDVNLVVEAPRFLGGRTVGKAPAHQQKSLFHHRSDVRWWRQHLCDTRAHAAIHRDMHAQICTQTETIFGEQNIFASRQKIKLSGISREGYGSVCG